MAGSIGDLIAEIHEQEGRLGLTGKSDDELGETTTWIRVRDLRSLVRAIPQAVSEAA